MTTQLDQLVRDVLHIDPATFNEVEVSVERKQEVQASLSEIAKSEVAPELLNALPQVDVNSEHVSIEVQQEKGNEKLAVKINGLKHQGILLFLFGVCCGKLFSASIQHWIHWLLPR